MYFNGDAQRRILDRFHFALNEGGFLFLGTSEALVTRTNLFASDGSKHHVFQKRPGLGGERPPGPRPPLPVIGPRLMAVRPGRRRLRVQPRGPAGRRPRRRDWRWPTATPGPCSRIGLGDVGRPFKDLELSFRPLELRSRIEQVLADRRPLTIGDVVYEIPGGGAEVLEIQILPIGADQAGGVSLTFAQVGRHKVLREELERAQRELETAYEEIQSTVEELETTNEELQSTNEELETTNEELQSTNEELETMNEELQSTNEELETINVEIRRRTADLDRANALLQSILTSLGSGVAVLDRDLAVLVWNDHAERALGAAGGGGPGPALPEPRHRAAGRRPPPAHPPVPERPVGRRGAGRAGGEPTGPRHRLPGDGDRPARRRPPARRGHRPHGQRRVMSDGALVNGAGPGRSLDGDAIRRSRARLTELLAGLDDDPLASKDHLQRVVAELTLNLEELLVAEEELRTQTEELAASRDAIDLERERYGELFEFAPDAYLVTDEVGTIIEANGAASRMLGVPSQFLEGKPLVGFADEESRRELRKLLNELQTTATTSAKWSSTGASVDERYVRLQPRDRPPFVSAIRAVSRPASREAPNLVRWMVRDVTSRLDLEEEIRFLHVEVELLAAVARVARLSPEPRPIDSLLQSVIDLAASALPGCELGLALAAAGPGARSAPGNGNGAVAAASGERARVLDRVELEDGDGPCAQAAAAGAPAEADLAQCIEEWPRFGALAADFGLVTAIGLPIETPAHRGALNVFAFTELSREARQLLPLLADQVMTAVANAELYESSQALAGHLERALETRGVIERAKGVLIARQGCDPDQAFDILRRASQRLNRKLHDIATDLVANATTGEVPDWAPWTAAAGPGRAPASPVPRPTRERPPGPSVPFTADDG